MKIIGNTVGTTLKPETALVKCQNLTEEEKAIARKNIGAAAENGSGGGVGQYETITEQVVSDADFSIDGFCRPAPKSGELFGTNTSYCRTDYIDISAYTSLTIHTRPRSDACSPCVWFDANKTYISGETAEILEESDYTYDVPEGAVYAIFSSEKTIENARYVKGTKTVFVSGGGADAENGSGGAENGSGGGVGHYETITEQVVSDADFSIDGFCRPAPKSGELFGTNTSYCRTDYIDISAYTSLTIHTRPRSDACSPCVWFDANKTYISGETAEILEESDYTYDVPEGAVYAIFSSEKTIENARYVKGTKTVFVPGGGGGGITFAQSKCYISPNGSDDNDGLTADTPVLTIEKARNICSADGELIFMEGDYENLIYDLSSFSKVSTIGNVRFIYYYKKITEATLAEGCTRVYQIPYTIRYSSYLWQLDVPDANTEISAEERHPLQRNRSHRLEHTRLYNVTKFDTTSTELADFLATMEATTDKWMYYTDGLNLYFTAPSADFAVNPVMIPGATTLKASEKKNVNISGLKIYFASILTTNLSGVLDNLIVGYHSKSGAIMWDNTFGLTLNNCEAVAGTNDGINGHDAGDITCYNCWGHDNADDGESDHEECHIIQYGGLYEYNGNGCTPASGASGEYFNTICRNNGAWDWVSDPAGTGFSAQSTSTTGAATMYCVGCCSTGNKIGFRQKNSSKSTFINCVSKDDETAFDSGTQINCAVVGSYVTMVATLDDGSTVTYKVLGEAVTE